MLQIMYYGLPAAGVICLSLLNQSFATGRTKVPVMKCFQDLSVLVTEVETGALVDLEDPNYPLLTKATRTIKTILNRTLLNTTANTPQIPPEPDLHSDAFPVPNEEDWAPWQNPDNWEFETDFWTNLAEHPIFAENDSF